MHGFGTSNTLVLGLYIVWQLINLLLQYMAWPLDTDMNQTINPQLTVVFINLGDYSKTCVKRPLNNRQNKDLNDKW